MKRIDRCFLANGGILVIVESLEGKMPNTNGTSAQLGVNEGGLVLLFGEYEVPLPEEMLDYIMENRLVTIYQMNGAHYLYSPTVTIELEKDALVEAKAVYRYHKSRMREEHRDKAFLPPARIRN